MKEIHELSKQYNFKILEDASHCIGADYHNHKIGSCKFSDACVFSFHPVKIITTGEGGAITTNSKKLDHEIKALRSHGIKRGVCKPSEDYMPYWYYEQYALGFNYRMTDIQASLGLSQLNQLDKFIESRRKIAGFYDKNINSDKITKPDIARFKDSSFHLYVIKLSNRNKFYEYLKDSDINTTVHYFPIHMQPYYQALGFAKGDFPEAEKYGKTAISIPIYSHLKIEQQKKIVNIINNF
jgi:dTDP-4-amino-4,6-dideoxygalactose transaminase